MEHLKISKTIIKIKCLFAYCFHINLPSQPNKLHCIRRSRYIVFSRLIFPKHWTAINEKSNLF